MEKRVFIINNIIKYYNMVVGRGALAIFAGADHGREKRRGQNKQKNKKE